MIYRDFQDMKLSALGFGSMRLPVVDGNDAQIDEAAALAMVDYALAHGVNYFDTAWGYHSGNSELVMGKALARYPREKFFLATKFPGYDLANMDKVEAIFEKQLEKCRVDYFDFYLFHNVCEMNIDAYLDPKYGIHDYLMKQKASGRIRHLGFSAHGAYPGAEALPRRLWQGHGVLPARRSTIWTGIFRTPRKRSSCCREYNIPVWVMEPAARRPARPACAGIRGAAQSACARRRASPPGRSAFCRVCPRVAVTLSGMSNMEQVKANIATFAEDKAPAPARRWKRCSPSPER